MKANNPIFSSCWIFISSLFLVFPFFRPVSSQQDLTSEEFYTGIQNGEYDAIIDARNWIDFIQGHIPGATYIEGVNSMSDIPPFPDLLEGGCNGSEMKIVVYCYVGGRAGNVIDTLIDAGYKATLYNGQGTNQWLDAGYDLVTEGSVNPSCYNGTDVDNDCCLLDLNNKRSLRNNLLSIFSRE